ncbi:BglG family transcription antiterminator [Evansella tamaricis]|uniref:BglG family transcription antiterminator n=1 Tax=Evansella tamaricis TaxID=2069301 RepID=A0ABS6JJY0_9BACI|nr:BglG family transcription antiterminator [Evansella tamaricis]MBU9713980.1 BglG family transcription antiterminator [Evansella tamaricis]
MTLDERCTQIITILMNTNGFIPVERMTHQLGISKRTVYYDVQKINDWLQGNNLEPVKKKHGKGYYLEQEAKEKAPSLIKKINKFQYFYSREERLSLMAVTLLTNRQPIFLEDLMELTQVSRATASNDLKEIKQIFQTKQLEVDFNRNNGYQIIGSEQRKQQLLVNCLAEIMTASSHELKNHLLEQIRLPFSESGIGPEGITNQLNSVKPFIEECEAELAIELTDEMVHLLALKLLVIIQRLQHGNRITLDGDERSALQSTKEYSAAENIAWKLEMMFHIAIPDDEIAFITMNLLGSKINYSDLKNIQSKEMEKLRKVVKTMVQDFQNYACILFQDRLQVEESLFKHLKPAYYRIKYNVSLLEVNTERVIKEFPEIFRLTKKTIHPLEQLVGGKITDSETAYISMHFGGWLQREGKKPVQRKRALIVCENGLGTSNILWGQMEKIIAAVDIVGCVSSRQYENRDYDVDYVFATSPIKHEKHPVLIVNPILTDKDKEAVLSFVNNNQTTNKKITAPSLPAIMNIVRKHTTILDEKEMIQELSLLFNITQQSETEREEKPVLNELLTKETIHYKRSAKDWKEAIRIAAAPLITTGSIREEYVDAMIANVEELGPYIVIAPEIALPHARPQDGVEKIGMSLLRLEESVYFSEQEKHRAKLIIVLAAVDNEKHLRALSQLTTMLSEEDVLQKVMDAKSADDIMTYINQYSFV